MYPPHIHVLGMNIYFFSFSHMQLNLKLMVKFYRQHFVIINFYRIPLILLRRLTTTTKTTTPTTITKMKIMRGMVVIRCRNGEISIHQDILPSIQDTLNALINLLEGIYIYCIRYWYFMSVMHAESTRSCKTILTRTIIFRVDKF